ncbi:MULTISPECIES: hypothetical protein [unclassified Streptomyces]|uniref:hypothetical protein n=1 Tax=unclassified Streptomyces TaxID=2593676 RepID=UPI0020331E15|nr:MULTISPECIES: hypothetical protein [unclassified Streptomyces]MCM2429343.1 hypothetical protein [Streptomyces sp. RKAG337]MCZ4101705.1 hypothetical protein [Streptomyces sp. H39-C1]
MPKARLPYDPNWDEDSRYIPWLDGPNDTWHVCDRMGPYTMVNKPGTPEGVSDPLVFADKEAAQRWLNAKYREWGNHPRLKKIPLGGNP